MHQGQRIVTPALMGKLWTQFQDEHPLLTEEEIRILRIVEGRTNAEIARNLSWSEVTVKRKIQTLYAKLGVTSRPEAAAKAIHERFI